MVSKNNLKNKLEQTAARTPHYGIRKLSVGVASVLISTTLYMGATTAKADTLPSTATEAATTNPETASFLQARRKLMRQPIILLKQQFLQQQVLLIQELAQLLTHKQAQQIRQLVQHLAIKVVQITIL